MKKSEAKNQFEVGQRVIRKDSVVRYEEYEKDQAIRGLIKMVREDGKITVRWDSSWLRGADASLVSASELIPEVEGDEKFSKLEAAYEAWAGPIRDKMTQAGALLLEANKLAQKQKRELTEMHDIVGPLIHAMDTVGWSTSSLSC